MSLYADIAFPLKLPPLTYKIPASSMPDLRGRVVQAPLMGRLSHGLVIEVYDEHQKPLNKDLKEIRSIHRQIASARDLQFLKWLSHYYITPIGVALRGIFFEEIVKVSNESPVTSHALKENISKDPPFVPEVNTEPLCTSIRTREYKTFLSHAGSERREHAFLLEVLGTLGPGIRGIVVLVPEIGQIGKIEPALRELFGGRLCIIHSRLSKKMRVNAVERLMSGESDIVVGTRSAILAPIRDLSFIAVTGEHDPSYKGEEGLRYHARDVAVMRGFIERTCVLLSSVCPSVESYYNASVGKYRNVSAGSPRSLNDALQSTDRPGPFVRPKIRLCDPGGSFRKDLPLSEELLKETKQLLSAHENILFLVNRKGYSLLRCDDCGNTVQCGNCRISMVFYKREGRVGCRYCGQSEQAPETCSHCSGARLKAFGAGTERVREEVERLLHTQALVLEKSRRPRGSVPADLSRDPGLSLFIVGTAYAARKAARELFGAVAFLNFDMLLSQPDFRAHERAFQEVVRISQLVRSGGAVFLQSSMAREKIMKFIRNYDFDGFYREELSQRKALRYPPFAKLVLLNIFAKRTSTELPGDIQAMLEEKCCGIELLGPLEVPSSSRAYRQCIQVLMKSKDSRMLHGAVQDIARRLEKMRGLKVSVDVDPIRV